MFQDLLNKQNKKTQKYTKPGYTLIEVIMAVVFFGIIALGIGIPFNESMMLSRNDQNIVDANNLARLYLKDTELKWLLQSDFDAGELPELTEKYTANGKYIVTVNQTDVASNTEGIPLVKRVNITYKDNLNTTLVDIFLDYNRPINGI